jgi:diguanylate cyclase (GGDEF)-like protein/PAS domain S-box-containing protein
MVAQLDAIELRALFEHVLDGVLFSRPDGSIVAANPAACAMLGGTKQQVLAAGRAGLTDTSDPRWATLLAERARDGRAHGRLRMRRLDGSTFECELSSSVFTTSDGQQSACVVMRDVSPEQRLMAELLRAERLWRLTLQHAAAGIALVSLDGRWLHVNPALCRIVGYSEAELLSKTFQDITFPEDLDADLDLLNQVVAGLIDDYTLDKRYVHSDGHLVRVRLHVALVRDEQDEPLHFVSQIVDITAEHAQQTLLAELASRDTLTAVANRGALFSALATVPPGEAIAVAFIDVDDFKTVNDRLGHAAGDELLVTISDRLVSEVRPQDVVARVGGDEFAILLRHVGTLQDLELLAHRLLLGLAAPYTITGTPLTVTTSIGIARAVDSRDAETLLAAADAAMYEAKRSGKGTMAVATAAG